MFANLKVLCMFVENLRTKMKVMPSLRIKYSLSTIDIANDKVPFFYYPLYYHSELELKYVEQNSGTRYVGDRIEPFGPGVLCLIGSMTQKAAKTFYIFIINVN
jgi:hypothetical protein